MSSAKSTCCQVILILCLAIIVCCHAQYTFPSPDIVALAPIGIRVSIPDVSGIRRFAFHGKIGKDLRIDGEGVRDKGRWVFQDLNVQLKPSDVIKYWMFVQHDGMGYRRDQESFTVQSLVTLSDAEKMLPTNTGPTRNPNCTPSISISNGKAACQGRVIFEDKFNTLDKTKWTVEQRLVDDQQEAPFVSYQPSSVNIEQNKLKISPRLQSSMPGFKDKIKTGKLDLSKGCTSMRSDLCVIQAEGANFLPPIVSGRISSKNSFSFKYGRVDIVATLPQGDWIYPELYLMPTKDAYGTDGYESGVIRIAFTRGNLDLQTDTELLNNNVLSGGVLLDQMCRTQGVVKNLVETEAWGGVEHTYSLIWEPEKLTFYVDNVAYGAVTPPEGGFASYLQSPECYGNPGASRWAVNSLAPFDKEFHVVIGVGVGGISDFPDDVGNKPWRNASPKARSNFWKQLGSWYSTWESNKNLYVNSIKVTAL